MTVRIQLPPEYRKSGASGELYSQIEIRASPERIWEILSDFLNYPDWNPFIRNIQGKAVVGERITVDISHQEMPA
jgi:hypothetical protein